MIWTFINTSRPASPSPGQARVDCSITTIDFYVIRAELRKDADWVSLTVSLIIKHSGVRSECKMMPREEEEEMLGFKSVRRLTVFYGVTGVLEWCVVS